MSKALLIVDVQNDFVEGGSLACSGGLKLSKKIYDYYIFNKDNYKFIFLSRDWHIDVKEHFKKWPEHCVANTNGAGFVGPINKINGIIVSKGQFSDGYSTTDGILENEKVSFVEFVLENKITEFDICGIATDYCVLESAIRLKKYINKVNVLKNLCVGVSENTTKKALKALVEKGVSVI